VTVHVGSVTDLGVAATVTGGGTLSFEWFSNTSAVNTGGTATGGTGAVFTIPNTLTAGRHFFYVVVSATGTAPDVASNVATVTVQGSGTVAGDGSPTTFDSPFDVAVDSFGNVFVADSQNHRIRRIESDTGLITTVAGSGAAGFADGIGALAQFNAPAGIALDNTGNFLIVADMDNHRIRRIEIATGNVQTIAGSGTLGDSDGLATAAQFAFPYGVAVDGGGNIFVADWANHRIRRIESGTWNVATVAGSGLLGFADGVGALAQFNAPAGIALDNTGNFLIVADAANQRIRRIEIATWDVQTIAGSGTAGFIDGPALTAQFNWPYGVAIDNSNNVFVADTFNNRIRRIENGTWVVTTLAGNWTWGSLEGFGAAAQFFNPYGIAVDSSSNVFVADTFNNRIRRITQ